MRACASSPKISCIGIMAVSATLASARRIIFQCNSLEFLVSKYARIVLYYPGMTLEKIDWNAPAREPLAALKAVPFSALPPLEDGERYARVRVDSVLNVREAPSTDSGVLDQLENGRRIILCGEADEHGWVKIRTAERTGYIRMDYAVTE